MTDRELRDEVITLLVAGHETTALTLAWALFEVARHPDVDAVLAEEVARVLGPDRPPSHADLPSLPVTADIVNETLRLYPAGYLTARECIEDVEIGGHPITKGTLVLMSQWEQQRDPAVFEDRRRVPARPLVGRPSEGARARRLLPVRHGPAHVHRWHVRQPRADAPHPDDPPALPAGADLDGGATARSGPDTQPRPPDPFAGGGGDLGQDQHLAAGVTVVDPAQRVDDLVERIAAVDGRRQLAGL